MICEMLQGVWRIGFAGSCEPPVQLDCSIQIDVNMSHADQSRRGPVTDTLRAARCSGPLVIKFLAAPGPGAAVSCAATFPAAARPASSVRPSRRGPFAGWPGVGVLVRFDVDF